MDPAGSDENVFVLPFKWLLILSATNEHSLQDTKSLFSIHAYAQQQCIPHTTLQLQCIANVIND